MSLHPRFRPCRGGHRTRRVASVLRTWRDLRTCSGEASQRHLRAAPLSASGTGSATARMCAQRSSRRVSWPFISGSGGAQDPAFTAETLPSDFYAYINY